MSVASASAEGLARFATARASVDRSAFSRFLNTLHRSNAGGLAPAVARELFNMSAPLADPAVRELALSALMHAGGAQVRPVTVTVWPSVRRTFRGEPHRVSWEQFGAWHQQWAALVIPKGEGHIYNATTTVDGHRCNASTTQIFALILDVDGTGDWYELGNAITTLRLAAIFHRSGGHGPTLPKWRVILPLSEPFRLSTPNDLLAWRSVYSTARTALGAIGRLCGTGFDPATDLPCNAWYPGYRRTADAPTREVVVQGGATLDLALFAKGLPPPTARQVDRHGDFHPHVGRFPSLLELAFAEAELLGEVDAKGRRSVICPWNAFHSQPLSTAAEATTSTVIFPSASRANFGGFRCLHSSCGSRNASDVLDELSAEAVYRARQRHLRCEPDAGSQRPNGEVQRSLSMVRPGELSMHARTRW